MIVSNVAGTTRDAIDTNVMWNGKEYVFIDTAGLRRKNKIKEELERYSIIRTVTAVERADVVVVVIDAVEGVTEQDAKIAGIAHERGKGIIIAVNKWDAVEKDDKTIYKYTNKVREVLVVHAVCGDHVYLRRDRTASSKAVRNDRYGTGKSDTADPDGCAQRDHDGSGRAAAATVRQRKTAEAVLYHAGIRETADICYLCQR